jgi:O-antigen/teichoic acid export membrane protein
MVIGKKQLGKITEFFQSEKIIYVLINVFLAIASFIRSYIIMKYMGFYEVGLIAMLISTIEFISFMQFGLLNGAFRMIFVNTKSVNSKINATLYTYFLFLFLLSLLGYILYSQLIGNINEKTLIIFLGISLGIISLVKNWVSNQLIAVQDLKFLNRINFYSTLLALSTLILIPFYSKYGAILGVAIQPIFFITYTLIYKKDFRPIKILYNKRIIKKMIFIGFIPFLAGILVKLVDQVERWGIIGIFGIDSLGKYNLAILYGSLFLLIPSSITQMIYPNAINFFKQQQIFEFKGLLKKYLIYLSLYISIMIMITIFLMPVCIKLLLPNYNSGIIYVWYIMPYLFAQVLVMPLDLIFMVLTKYKVMFFSYTVAVVVFLSLVLFIKSIQEVDLKYIPLSKSISGTIFLLMSYLGFKWFISDKIFKRNDYAKN